MRLQKALRTLKFNQRRLITSAAATSTHPTRAGSTAYIEPTHSIYVSKSTNPYFNLSLEDWLFRKACPDRPLLLIYRDDPCVVIGRNQNPWKEVNLEAASLRGIPWLRRRSGGGTVYHDHGNTNYSIHVPRTLFDRRSTANVIVKALHSMKIPADVNERNDICVQGFKVSGSAYKIANKRAYHHGTMLISAQLDTLGDLLRTKKESMITKGVASVRSPVRNLVEFSSEFGHDSFVNSVVTSFQESYGIREEVNYVDSRHEMMDIPHIRDGINELQSWEWKYGQTPEFEYTVTERFQWGEAKATLRSKHGIVTGCEVDCPGVDSVVLSELCKAMEGTRYGYLGAESGSQEFLSKDALPPGIQEVFLWLCEEMRV